MAWIGTTYIGIWFTKLLRFYLSSLKEYGNQNPLQTYKSQKWILICPYETKQTMLICKEFIIKTVFIIGSKKKKSSKSFLKFVLI